MTRFWFKGARSRSHLSALLTVLLVTIAACASPSAEKSAEDCQSKKPDWLKPGVIRLAQDSVLQVWADETVLVVHFCDPRFDPSAVPPLTTGRSEVVADSITSYQGRTEVVLEAVYPLSSGVFEASSWRIANRKVDLTEVTTTPEWCLPGELQVQLPQNMSVEQCGSLFRLEWKLNNIPRQLQGRRLKIFAEVGVVTPRRPTTIAAPVPAGTRVRVRASTMRVSTGIPLNDWALTRCLELTVTHVDIVGQVESAAVQTWAARQRSSPVCLRMPRAAGRR